MKYMVDILNKILMSSAVFELLFFPIAIVIDNNYYDK